MPQPSLQDKIYSNDYFDAILPVTISNQNFLDTYAHLGAQLLGARFGMIHLRNVPGSLPQGINYSLTPKLFAPLDTTSLEVSGILRVQTQPSLGYRGEGVILGFLDTGIDYTLKAFRSPSGDTRILGIWDQTRPSDSPPFDIGYGTEYTYEDINRALRSDAPYDIVQQKDEDGHGTFVAGIAAGSEDVSGSFIGAAPALSLIHI